MTYWMGTQRAIVTPSFTAGKQIMKAWLLGDWPWSQSDLALTGTSLNQGGGEELGKQNSVLLAKGRVKHGSQTTKTRNTGETGRAIGGKGVIKRNFLHLIYVIPDCFWSTLLGLFFVVVEIFVCFCPTYSLHSFGHFSFSRK